VPATVEVTELAGRGNEKTLLDVSEFRRADALMHVLRLLKDDRASHAADSVDPTGDASQMEDKLELANLDMTEQHLDRLRQNLKKKNATNLRKKPA
jgi:ribosome-binding ATPase YchF (GTP1/OBG family)